MLETEKPEEKTGITDYFLIVFLIFLILTPLIVFSVIGYLEDQNKIQHLKDEIKQRDVSPGYRQGWLDCIAELERYRYQTSNATATR